jgi:hypothetical protein
VSSDEISGNYSRRPPSSAYRDGVAPKYVGTTQLAKELGLSPRTIQRYVTDGQIKPAYITPGGQYRWDPEDVLAQLRRLRPVDRDE